MGAIKLSVGKNVYTHYELGDLELCYFAALIDGLRIIGEAEKEKGRPADMDGTALVRYVQDKGKQIYNATRPQFVSSVPRLGPGPIQVSPAQKPEIIANRSELIANKPELIANKSPELPEKLKVCPSNFYQHDKVREAATLLLSGNSVRETAHAMNMCKATVSKIRSWVREILGCCPCGRKNGHHGWCKHRLAKKGRKRFGRPNPKRGPRLRVALRGQGQCPRCGRLVATVNGKIINHRERTDKRGYGNGPWCEYSEAVT